MQQGQPRRNLQLQMMAGQGRLQGLQRRADHFLDRLPLPVQAHRTTLQARHIEQVVDHGTDALGLLLQGSAELARLGRQLGRSIQGLGQAIETGQRRAQIMRQGREQGVAQSLALDVHQGLLRHLDIMHTLQGLADDAGIGLQLGAQLRQHQAPAALGFEGQHAAGAHGRLQGQVKPGAAGQGVGAQTGGLAMVQGPAGGAGIGPFVRSQARQAGLTAETAAAASLQVQGHTGKPGHGSPRASTCLGHVQHLPRSASAPAKSLVSSNSARERGFLARPTTLRLISQARSQLPGDQADSEHDSRRSTSTERPKPRS